MVCVVNFSQHCAVLSVILFICFTWSNSWKTALVKTKVKVVVGSDSESGSQSRVEVDVQVEKDDDADVGDNADDEEEEIQEGITYCSS